MRVFDTIKTKDIEEFSEWLDEYGMFDDSPWMNWFDKNYCNNCESETVYVPAFKIEAQCSWCELHKKCKYFTDMNNIPDNKEIIKMWLESELE